MDRTEIESLIRRVYERRLANDVEGCAALFTPDTRYTFSGSAAHCPVCTVCDGGDSFRDLLGALVTAWPWRKVDFKRMLIDGDQASVEYALTVEHASTGQRHTTDVANLLTFRNGKVASCTEYVDTALVASLVGGETVG